MAASDLETAQAALDAAIASGEQEAIDECTLAVEVAQAVFDKESAEALAAETVVEAKAAEVEVPYDDKCRSASADATRWQVAAAVAVEQTESHEAMIAVEKVHIA